MTKPHVKSCPLRHWPILPFMLRNVNKSSHNMNSHNSNLTNSTTCGASEDVRRSNLCSICITVVNTDVSIVALTSETRTLMQAARSVLNRTASLPIATTAASATYNDITCPAMDNSKFNYVCRLSCKLILHQERCCVWSKTIRVAVYTLCLKKREHQTRGNNSVKS